MNATDVAIPPLDEHTALLVVDLQVATTSQTLAHDVDSVVGNAARLAAAFRERGLPVVVVRDDLNHPPAGRTSRAGTRPPLPDAALEVVPELAPTPGDLVITKRGWAPFAGPQR